MIKLTTNHGAMTLELDAEKAPKSVANFLAYVDAGFYDGTIFHRVISNFMIQGGGYTADLKQKPTQPPVKNEAANGIKNTRGTVAMARTAVVDSATSQFFINHADNGFLDFPGSDGWGYCVFGKVTEGMDVVDKIATTQTGGGDAPVKTITIKSVTVLEPAKK